jgi:transketolase
MALAAAHLGAIFNRADHRIVDHRVYVVLSDGDLMEGISHEVASLAGHLKLGNLVALFDDNRITIDGPTSLTCSDDVAARFEAYEWHVQHVGDGNDLHAIDRALDTAKAEEARPSLIIVRTHIGFGSPNKQDTAAAHGAPLGGEEVRLAKERLSWPYDEPFTVPAEALAEWRQCVARGQSLQAEWEATMAAYADANPAAAAELRRRLEGRLPDGWERTLPVFAGSAGPMATRAASGKVLNAVASIIPELLGGSADLAGSNNTLIKGAKDLGPAHPGGRNMYFGVREHGMAAIMNGMALHGGIIPYGGTFLVFSDYMRPSIRLAAMMGLKVIYVFTHDSIGLGEDGPTHQPVETLTALRAIPNLTVIRPGDAAETVEAWRVALRHRGGPIALVLTRQKVPTLDRHAHADAGGLARGAYILADAEGGSPEIILLASGSELAIVLEAGRRLSATGVPVRVVSVPSLELFRAQPEAYRRGVLPPTVPVRLAVEAADMTPWYPWVGDSGDVLGMRSFGRSAPDQRLFEEFGLSPEGVVNRVHRLLAR